MYVCIYVCVYLCMCVCVYVVRMYVCMYACMHVCMYANMHVCMYACMYVCMYVCMYDVVGSCGHGRMNKNRRAKQVMNWTPGRKRGRGRPRKKLAGDHPRRPAGLELTWVDALDAAEDRAGWRKRITRCAVQHGRD